MTGSFVSPGLRQRVRGLVVPVALALGRLGLTPNTLTVIGFGGTVAAALAAAGQQWLLAGILVVAFGIFDLFDGALARATGRTSKFGAFLDSTLDRTGENLVYAGIIAGAIRLDMGPSWMVGATAAVAMAFASVVTYARAKAELVGLHGEVGFAPREVRLAILGLALILTAAGGGLSTASAVLAGGLGLIAILSAVTVVQRIVHVERQLHSTNKQ